MSPCGSGRLRGGQCYDNLRREIHALCTSTKPAVVEGLEGFAVPASGEVQGIGKVHALTREEGLGDTLGLLDVDVGETQQMFHDLDDLRPIEAPLKVRLASGSTGATAPHGNARRPPRWNCHPSGAGTTAANRGKSSSNPSPWSP